MPKPIILVDICNSICDVNQILIREFGHKPSPGTYAYPDISEDFFIKNLWIFEEAKPMEYSQKALWDLSVDYKIVYATARPVQAGEITKRWLEKYNYPDGAVYHCPKKAKLAGILGAKLAIDDAPHVINEYREAGIPVWVVAQEYNREIQNRFLWCDFK